MKTITILPDGQDCEKCPLFGKKDCMDYFEYAYGNECGAYHIETDGEEPLEAITLTP